MRNSSKHFAPVLTLFFLTIQLVTSQTDLSGLSPLVLITQKDHVPAFDIQSIAEILKTFSSVKAVSIQAADMQSILQELTQTATKLGVTEKQITSMITSKQDLMKLLNIDFQAITEPKDIQLHLRTREEPLLIHITGPASAQKRQARLLEVESEAERQGDESAEVEENLQKSNLFINMSPATLAGLMISLFLIVILVVAIKCLYDVKTNDDYGRNNLWVGKES